MKILAKSSGCEKILANSWGCENTGKKLGLCVCVGGGGGGGGGKPKIPSKNTANPPQKKNNNQKSKQTIVVVKINAMGTRPTVIQQGLKLMFMYKLFPSFRA